MNKYVTVQCTDCGRNFQVSDTTELRHRNDAEFKYRCPTCKSKYIKDNADKRNNSSVSVICEKCGRPFSLIYKIYHQRCIKGRRMICKECLRKENSERGKRQFESMTQEERDAWSQRTKEQMANRSPDEWLIIKAKRKKTVDNWSDEKKLRMREMPRQRWANMSQEERDVVLDNLDKGREKYLTTRSAEEKERAIRDMQRGRDKYFANLTEEERLMRNKELAEAARRFWSNISPEEYAKYHRNRREGIDRYKANNDKHSKTEVAFAHILFRNGLQYYQNWVNQLKHPDFDTEFPYNLITGASYVDYHHEWDFIVLTKDKDILVDVDGS